MQVEQQNKQYAIDKIKSEDSRRGWDFYILYLFYLYSQYTTTALLDQLCWLENYTFQKKQAARPTSASKIWKENNIK